MLQKQNNNTTILTGIQAVEELKQMHLSSDQLLQACLLGVLSRENCTDYNTKGGPGFIQWDSTVKALREYCCGQNWIKFQENGLEGIISIDGKIRILPSSGNVVTGNINQNPSNKNSKGIRTIQLIEKSMQGSLFNGYPDQLDDDNVETYVLLYYNNSKELRMELSKPLLIKKGKIVAWEKRIIIKSFNLNNPPSISIPIVEDDIDIPVTRKINEG